MSATRIVGLLCVVALTAGLLLGCSAESQLEGRWNRVSEDGTSEGDSVEFYSDGSYQTSWYALNASWLTIPNGQYAVVRDGEGIEFSGDGDSITVNYRIEDGKLYLRQDNWADHADDIFVKE